jgi:hypothetical protein
MFEMCYPALFYLIFSTVFMALLIYENVGNTNVYCLGTNSCDVKNAWLILFIQFVYIFISTAILIAICKFVSPIVAWIVVFIPLLLFAIFTGSIFIYKDGGFQYA